MGKEKIKTIKYSCKDKGPNYEINMHIDLERFERQYNRAQYELDSMVMTSMVPYMPMDTGTFINVTRAMSAALAGSGKVVAAAPPMGRFLYEGKVMVGERTRSAFAAKGERKEVIERDLQFSRSAHPSVTSHWFETAKKNHGTSWVNKAKKLAGGG